jgi:hypothetical protein
MKSIITRETNSAMVTDEEGYGIPVQTDGKYAISTWQLSFWERILVLLTGRVYVRLTLNQQQMQQHRVSTI